MRAELEALERVRVANPVPDEDQVGGPDLTALFAAVEERRSTMSTGMRERTRTEEKGPRRRVVAVAVFAAAMLVVIVAVGVIPLLVGNDDEIAPAEQTPTTTVQPTTTTSSSPTEAAALSPIAPSTGRVEAGDLCVLLTGDEILDIVARAYAAEGVDYPIPEELEARPASPQDFRPGCDWTVPGTTWGWGYSDFTVVFRDAGPAQRGPSSDPSASPPQVRPLEAYELEDRRLMDLVPQGLTVVSDWSPGILVYVDDAERVLSFRHDLAAGSGGPGTPPNGIEDYRVEIRILSEILRRIGWLPAGGG